MVVQTPMLRMTVREWSEDQGAAHDGSRQGAHHRHAMPEPCWLGHAGARLRFCGERVQV